MLYPRYEIRIAGRLDETVTAAAFGGLKVAFCSDVTVIRGELDQSALHGVLERIRYLRLDLVEARRAREFPDFDPARPGESRRPRGGIGGNACLRN